MIDRRTAVILLLACAAAGGGWWVQQRWLTPPAWAPGALTQPPAPAGVTTFAVGAAVGDYQLPGLDGQPVALSQWHGKALLLNFWATWCAPCREEMPMLAAMQRQHAAAGLQVVGVAMEQAASAAALVQKYPVGYPILVGLDADPVATTMFGDTAGLLPYSVLIGRDGRVLDTKLGLLDAATVDAWLALAAASTP